MSIGEAGEKLRRSTVLVQSGNNGSGSGIIWNTTGTIVTNAHVARNENCTIEFWDGLTAPARLDRRDIRRDLAILRVNPVRTSPVHHRDSTRLRVGELVIAVGNPLGFKGALSTGVLHAVGPAFIESTVRLAPGNSGGPLADAEGDVIGINTAIAQGGLGLAVPANAVERLLTSAPPPELGVTVRPVRIPGPRGRIALVVLEIAKGGPADYASLRAGDLLIGANGKRFASVDDLHESLANANRSLTIQFLRGDERKERETTVRTKCLTNEFAYS